MGLLKRLIIFTIEQKDKELQMKKTLIVITLLLTNIHASGLSAMQTACENQIAEACYHFGILYEQGSGVIKDSMKAKEYYLKACEYGYDKACKNFELIKTECEKCQS